MYYLDPRPTENKNYGNPHSAPKDGDLRLPDDLLSDYIDAMGFVMLTVGENNEIISVERNDEAYNAYIADHPIVPDEEDEPETANDILDALLGVEE